MTGRLRSRFADLRTVASLQHQSTSGDNTTIGLSDGTEILFVGVTHPAAGAVV